VDEQARFEAAIACDPDDGDAYLVYADWLQQRGDPRGELIVLQHRGEDDAAKRVLQRHAEHFYGGLSARPNLVAATWQLGFMRSCRFSLDDDRGAGHEQRALAALEELLALPSARFLREIAIDVMNVPYNHMQPAIELMDRRDWQLLERLALGEGIEHSTATATDAFTTELGPVRRLLEAAPNLRTLILESTEDKDPDFDGLALPRLRELRIFGPGGYELLQTLPRAELPELVTLDLLGSFVADPSDWSALLSGASLPKLRHLGFGVYAFLIGRAGALIANAPILRQLETLDLSNTPLIEPDIDAILANAGAFAHLQRLELGPLLFDNAPTAALRGLCADVRLR
jgi:uncharacterized protein (TIGR02996 family)